MVAPVVGVMPVALFHELNFMRVHVAAMRQVKDGLELVRLGNMACGFKQFALRVKVKSLTRAVRAHRFNCHGGVCRRGTRPFARIVKEESKARWRTSFKDRDFDKAVADVHNKTAVRTRFDSSKVMRVSAEEMCMFVARAAKLLDHIVETKGQQRTSGDPRKPTPNLIAQLDAAPCDQEAESCGEKNVPAASQRRDK